MVVGSAFLLLVFSTLAFADAKPENESPLAPQLKELKWLVGEYSVRLYAGSGKSVSNVTVVKSKDGKKLIVQYTVHNSFHDPEVREEISWDPRKEAIVSRYRVAVEETKDRYPCGAHPDIYRGGGWYSIKRIKDEQDKWLCEGEFKTTKVKFELSKEPNGDLNLQNRGPSHYAARWSRARLSRNRWKDPPPKKLQ